jgi:hypothetical protein
MDKLAYYALKIRDSLAIIPIIEEPILIPCDHPEGKELILKCKAHFKQLYDIDTEIIKLVEEPVDGCSEE